MTRFKAPAVYLVSDGDSNCNLPASPDNIPTVLGEFLGYPQTSVGVDAATSAQVTRRFASHARLLGNCGTETIYHLLVGHNDINTTVNAATLVGRMEGLADLARAAGFNFVVTSTITPTDTFSGGEETVRGQANALLLADGNSKFDLVIDLTQDPDFEDFTGFCYADGLHKSVAGAAKYVDDYAGPQIQTMLNAG